MSASLAIRTQSVLKSFGTGEARTPVLKGVDFEARTGELMMIVGPSGCGKTTLLSVVAGTLEFDGGEIEIFGSQIHRMKGDQITGFRKKNIGFVFQQFNLIPTLTCLENVSVPLLINGMSHRAAEKKSKELLDHVGLEGKWDKRPSMLSGGQQQRVAIARALVHEPRLLICDEPTSALDSENGQKIMQLLREVGRSPERCVVVVTHDNRVFKYADRIAEMEDGKVLRISDKHDHLHGH